MTRAALLHGALAAAARAQSARDRRDAKARRAEGGFWDEYTSA